LALAGTEKAPTVVAVAIPVVSLGLPIIETSLSVFRRVIGGRPIFIGDREHIHHKLLQHGMTHRQVVILLYGVCAIFALLSLFLLWPSGGSIGLVLAVLGTGVWVGVQHLGYLEFGELARVAQRTLAQRQIFINDLAIRRATEALKGAGDYSQVCRILADAFSTNDFDGFQLGIKVEVEEPPTVSDKRLWVKPTESLRFEWSKPGAARFRNGWAAWNLGLDLVTSSNRRLGSINFYRVYKDAPLLLDANLLISVFPIVLADALDRALASNESVTSEVTAFGSFVAAEAS
jgi:hypothetical protein